MDTKSIQASEIKITDDIGMKMNFPSLDTVQKYATEGEDIKSENVFHLIVECIDYIWDGEDIFKAKDSTKKELNDFIESLSSGQFAKVRDFFESIPKLEHEIEWVCSKCKKSTSLVLQGIDAFFE
jgi:hypothetical protein